MSNTLSSLPFSHLDDENFRLTLFELNNGSINFDPEKLDSLKFNSLLSTSYRNFSLCKDRDPDSNFYSQFHNCEYYTKDSFYNRLANLNINTNNRGNLALFHLNIYSISYKLGKMSNFLQSVGLKSSVIGISETWLDDSSLSSDIPDFNFIHNHRVGRTGGGVCLYLADYLKFKYRADLVFSEDCAESLFVEIDRTNGKNIVIGVIYRPPDRKLRDFIFEQEQLVSAISKENKTVF